MTVIKIRRLEWLGRVSRMNKTRAGKKICEGKLEGRRGRRRPRLRWINDVEEEEEEEEEEEKEVEEEEEEEE